MREETGGSQPPYISQWWEFKGPMCFNKFDPKDDPAECEYRIDATQTPPQIDLISSGQVLRRGIYQLNGNELTVCYSIPPAPRPTTFDTRSNTSLHLTVLRRESPATPQNEVGWVQLFNGKDLTGWKNHPDQPGDWKVENGMLVGRGRRALLYSGRGDYGDFDLHIEAKVNDGGEGGVYLRTPDFPPVRKLWSADPKGHRVVLSANSKHDPLFKTGSLKTWRPAQDYLVQASDRETPPDQWFTLDVLARGPDIIVRVNGKKTAQIDKAAKHDAGLKGFLVLEANTDGRVIHIRKIEIKERMTAVTNN